MIKIIIADDHKLFRETLAVLLGSNPPFKVVATCADSLKVIEAIKREKPDIVLMDIEIGPISGIEAVQKITAASSTG